MQVQDCHESLHSQGILHHQLWILNPAQLPCLITGDKVVTLWAIPTLTARIVCRRARAPQRILTHWSTKQSKGETITSRRLQYHAQGP
jgi:hypothetical protein